MKRDTEIIRDILLWLLDDPKPTGSAPFNILANAPLPEEGSTDVSGDSWDPFESEAFAIVELDPGLLNPGSIPHPVSLGEIPAVQDRFQALIKRRLRLEIERHPPLFPWEQHVQEYPEWLGQEAPAASLWLDHLRHLKLPALLPDEVMAALLQRCQDLANQPLKSGVRLVKAVESLFPEQPQTLQNVARLVLSPAYRSGSAAAELSLDYDSANTQQQVALAMLAAQEIFSSLALALSPQQPLVERQWVTPAGTLTLKASYQPDGSVQIQGVLPQAGYLQVAASRIERTAAGEVIGVLDQPQPGQVYPVTVGLGDFSAAPLQFSLWLDAQAS